MKSSLLSAIVAACATMAGCTEVCTWNPGSQPFELEIDADMHAVAIVGYHEWLAVSPGGTVVHWGHQYSGEHEQPFVHMFELGDADIHAVWTDASWWVVGDAGTVAVSDNRGATWNPLTLPGGTADLHAITSFAGHMVIVGDELVLVRVADGTWLEPPAPADGWGQLRGVAATSDRIYAVGLAGAFWSASDPSGEWTAMAGGIADDLLDVGTYGDYWATPEQVAVVGSQGTVLIAGGNEWRRRDTGVSVDLIDYDQSHALGSDGGIYRIDQHGPLVLTDTIDGARAMIHDSFEPMAIVGDDGLAIVPIGFECH